MARSVEVILTDDVSGGPASETIEFTFGGVNYEIDLNDANARSFKETMDDWIDSAHVAASKTRRKSTGASAKPKSDVDTKAVREWARSNGLDVSARGRVGADLIAQYEAAIAA